MGTADCVGFFACGGPAPKQNGAMTVTDSYDPGTVGWAAVIGPTPRPSPSGLDVAPHNKCRVLDQTYEIAGMRIRSNDTPLVEYLRDEPRRLRGVYEFVSWPVVVEGDADPAPQLALIRTAAAPVQRLAQLLALAWNEPWQTRSAPWHSDQIADPVGDSWAPPPEWRTAETGWADQKAPEPLPAWIPGASALLPEVRAIRHSLGIWHQGLLTEALHPSLALAAYVASLDAVSSDRGALHKLGIGIAPDGGPTARVRHLIDCVAVGDERAVLRDVYARRSRTVHAGGLHGSESTIGAVFGLDLAHENDGSVRDISASDPNRDFTWRIVPAARSVARAALLRLFDG